MLTHTPLPHQISRKTYKYNFTNTNTTLANIDGEILHIFWTTWGILMKFPGKMWLTLILNVTQKTGFTLSLEYTFLEKPQGAWNWPSHRLF